MRQFHAFRIRAKPHRVFTGHVAAARDRKDNILATAAAGFASGLVSEHLAEFTPDTRREYFPEGDGRP
jgi:hypothetical protein